MKFKLWSLILFICWGVNLYANVTPRYKAHLYVKYFVVNGDSALKNGEHEIEVYFFEESELTPVCQGKDGDVVVRMMGRPVWRDGHISHRFISTFYFRKNGTDRWTQIFDRDIYNWKFKSEKQDSLYLKSESSSSNEFGSFFQSFNVKIELLNSKYEVAEDSTFVAAFVFEPFKIRIEGKELKLKANRFEVKGKTTDKISIGKKDDLSVTYKIYEGTAKSNTDFEVKLFFTYFDKNALKFVTTDLSSNYVNKSDPDFRTSVASYNDDGSESLYIEYCSSVNRIFNSKIKF